MLGCLSPCLACSACNVFGCFMGMVIHRLSNKGDVGRHNDKTFARNSIQDHAGRTDEMSIRIQRPGRGDE